MRDKKSNGINFTRFFSYLKPHMPLFFIGLVTMLLVTAANLSGPLILRALIDKAIPAKSIKLMILYSSSYVVIIIIMGILTWIELITIMKLGLNIITAIKKDLFAHLLKLPVSYFDAHSVGELMARVENDTDKVRSFFSETGVELLSNILYFVGMLIVFFTIDPKTALYISSASPFVLGGFFFFYDKLRPLYKKGRKKYAEITAYITEFIQGIEIIKAFNKQKYVMERAEKISREKRNTEIKSGMLEYTIMGFMGFLSGPMLIVLIIKLVVPSVFSGALTVGTLLVFIEYGLRLFEPLLHIGENIRTIQFARVATERIFNIMDIAPETSGSIAPVFNTSIEFKNVCFEYVENEPVLDNVSFKIEKGKTIALVGASGSGKTTAVSLLCRFYDVNSGSILIDGININDMDLTAWRKKIGLVLQDIYLFPGTILENVRIYDDSQSEEAVWNALKTVQANEFIEMSKHGVNTELYERGSNISTGEKQLLSFARAIVFDSEIIIMDEATASLDVATEKRIQKSMDTLLTGKTAIIVAHRLSSILKADNILLFRKGKIIAQGKHSELMRTSPEYIELVELQFPYGYDVVE